VQRDFKDKHWVLMALARGVVAKSFFRGVEFIIYRDDRNKIVAIKFYGHGRVLPLINMDTVVSRENRAKYCITYLNENSKPNSSK
jgi:hypothetical protein